MFPSTGARSACVAPSSFFVLPLPSGRPSVTCARFDNRSASTSESVRLRRLNSATSSAGDGLVGQGVPHEHPGKSSLQPDVYLEHCRRQSQNGKRRRAERRLRVPDVESPAAVAAAESTAVTV